MNRSQIEDSATAVPVETVDALFGGMSYRRIDVDVGDTSALASELWRIFLIAMIVALLIEAVLSLPSRRHSSQQSAIGSRFPSPTVIASHRNE